MPGIFSFNWRIFFVYIINILEHIKIMKKIGKSSKIFLASHEGLLGNSLLKALLNEKFLNINN